MFGNSSINISDQSGTAQLRIDADVNDLVGFAQPETCSEIIVGNYFAQQLLPRIRTDFPCDDNQQTGSDLLFLKIKLWILLLGM
jgi:hypothetical protein